MGSELHPIENVDYNTIIAEFINIKINEIIKLTTGTFSGVKKSLQVKLKTGYSKYLTNLTDRYGKSRSVFIRDEPKNLYSFYVPIGLRSENIIINTANLRAIQGVNKNIIICGSAGSGKSILLKHLLIN
jgi:type IV secretory pathway ATPase VirB11/archaellum biosynthesis ATPase